MNRLSAKQAVEEALVVEVGIVEVGIVMARCGGDRTALVLTYV